MVLNRLTREVARPGAVGLRLQRLPVERFQLTWNHVSGKGSPISVLEHVESKKPGNFFAACLICAWSFPDEYLIHAAWH
jgi:hypothetical protein